MEATVASTAATPGGSDRYGSELPRASRMGLPGYHSPRRKQVHRLDDADPAPVSIVSGPLSRLAVWSACFTSSRLRRAPSHRCRLHPAETGPGRGARSSRGPREGMQDLGPPPRLLRDPEPAIELSSCHLKVIQHPEGIFPYLLHH